MVIYIEEMKGFYKVQYPFMIKTLRLDIELGTSIQ
jgi:hypothetical protein